MKSALFIEKKFKEYIIYISLARASARVDGLVVVILIDLHFSSANVLDIEQKKNQWIDRFFIHDEKSQHDCIPLHF